MEKTMNLKAEFIKRMLESEGGLVNIHFRAGHTQLNIHMLKYRVKQDIVEYDYDEDDDVPEDETETYIEYTIIGETEDPGYQNHFTFVDPMIVNVKREIVTHDDNPDIVRAEVYHVDILDGDSKRYPVMFVFSIGILMPLPISLLQ
jgi:hypothetical protein